MVEKKVEIDEAKLKEYNEIRKVIEDTVGKKDLARICLNNKTLRQMAGYDNFNNDLFNPYLKDYLDKLSYDEHNKKVEEAKIKGDKETLQALSNEIMRMAGYVNIQGADESKINRYAKSFVDRTLIGRKINELYSAMKFQGDTREEKINEIYKSIYQMSSYGQNRPFGVINECADGFVESRMEQFKKRGIHIEPDEQTKEQYAI